MANATKLPQGRKVAMQSVLNDSLHLLCFTTHEAVLTWALYLINVSVGPLKQLNFYQRNTCFVFVFVDRGYAHVCSTFVHFFIYVVLLDVVKCFVGSSVNMGITCHCLQLQS